MTGIALALGSGLLWGCSDFWGGVISRRAPVLAVTLVSQGVGFVGLLAAFAVVRGVSWSSFRFGLLAGIGGASGLALFYWALAIGTMSIVAPIAGVQRNRSVLARSRRWRATVGARARGRSARHRRHRRRIVRGAPRAGSRPCAGDPDRRRGRGDDRRVRLANALFALAADRGLLAIVSVLGSVYPVATVLLAHLVLGERIIPVQRAGVVCALTGVAFVSVG